MAINAVVSGMIQRSAWYSNAPLHHDITPITMPANASSPHLVRNGPASAEWTIILAHGAGAAMDTPFMNYFAEGLADRGFHVARFEFPYMAERRKTGKHRPPDREPALRETWLAAMAPFDPRRLLIGGKSMGGRIASLIADDAGVAGLICLGYPFHPTGKPDQLRIEHLRHLRTPALIIQGERDPFGHREEVEGYELSSQVKIHWLLDGDHSFKPRKSSGRTETENWREAVETIGEFLSAL
jgi:predicted alpha/beta-hydrolase family hydrolase